MRDHLSILIVDSRPVRRSRLAHSLQTHDDCTIVGTLNFLPDAAKVAATLGADVVLVDGEQSESDTYAPAAEKLASQDIAVVPIWAYPQSQFDSMRAELMTPGTGSYGLAQNVHRIDLLLTTLRAAGQAGNTSNTPEAETFATEISKPALTGLQKAAPLHKIIALGASTGGVQALGTVLARAPDDAPPILIAQHMPEAFITGFVERLNRMCAITVKCAEEREPLSNGHAYVCPTTANHLTLSPTHNSISLEDSDPVTGHRPSVDRLFDSLVPVASNARCALLTGMGCDGAAALSRLRARGAMTIAQSEATCTVFGMPRAAIECEGAGQILDLDDIAPALFG